nr:hypothetical protein [Candidatus Delongbacteria bacterium]
MIFSLLTNVANNKLFRKVKNTIAIEAKVIIVKIVNIPLALITSIIIAKNLGPKDLGYAKFLILTLSTF